METRPLRIDRADAWAIHDCLQAALAGFSGRHESAEPWHALSLLAKVRSALLAFAGSDPPAAVTLDLTAGELECVDLNVPRTAYQGATALLLRVFHALEELALRLPLLENEPDGSGSLHRFAAWRSGEQPEP
ncbi:MAG: hypothetical protein C4290_09030 [Chloroflexota bacterium]